MSASLALPALPWPLSSFIEDPKGLAQVLGFSGLACGVWVAAFAGKSRKKAAEQRIELPGEVGAGHLMREFLARKDEETLLGAFPDRGIFARFSGPKAFTILPEHRQRHMQVMGPTRSGKSQLLFSLCAQDMSRGMPVFFMEAKGDVGDFSQFAKLAARVGRSQDVRYFNPADSRSMTLNPIRRVPGQDAVSIANQISRAIGREPGGGGDSEYFRSVDYARIQTMCEVFLKSGRDFTLKDAFHYFEFEECREKAFGYCDDKELVALARRQYAGRTADTSALTAHLRPWVTGRLGRILNSYSPQIRLEDVFENGRLAYLAIPIGHLQVLANSLGRMIVAGLLAVAFSRQKMSAKPGPASVILDEFPEFATPAFAAFIATVGSARLWTIFSHQDLGQLRKVEGIDPDVFFSALFSNSSGCKVFFHLPHPADAELIARAVGTYASDKTTEMIETGWLGESGTGKKSLREVEEFIAHPNLLKSLPPGTAVAWAHQRPPVAIETASVHELVKARRMPKLPSVQGPQRPGLDLAAAAPCKTGLTNKSSGSVAGTAG